MDTTRLAQLIGELADDLAPAAVGIRRRVGYLLAGAKPIEDDTAVLSVLACGSGWWRSGTI